MALELVTPAATTPVSLTELKQHIPITHSDRDTVLAIYLAAATARLDGQYGELGGRCLVSQVWNYHLDEFPCGAIRLPLAPVISVASVIYTDEDGVEQTIDAANYEVDLVSNDCWVVPVDGYSWPSTATTINAVRVTFTAGYGDPEDVPAPLKAAILLMATDLYRNSSTVTDERVTEVPMSMTVCALISAYRRATVAAA